MGKNRLAWAAWLLAAAALWLFENSAATLALLLASALLPALSILAARRARRALRVTLAAPESVEKGGALHAALTAERVGVFSRAAGRALCENRLTGERAETAFSFSPRLSGRAALALEADTAHCGLLRLRAEAWTEDLFGLWRSAVLPCGEAFAAVAPGLFRPRVTLAEAPSPLPEGERHSQTRPGSDPCETFAVREYVPGDPIRRIHWKLSEKTDKTMVREPGLPSAGRTLLAFRNVLAAGESVSPERADAMAEVFLSLSHALTDEGLVHTAAFAADGRYALTEIQNETDLRAMEARFLALSWEADDGALARLLTETPFDRAAVVSAAMPPEAAALGSAGRVTVLSASPAAPVDGVRCIVFSPERRREELGDIEL